MGSLCSVLPEPSYLLVPWRQAATSDPAMPWGQVSGDLPPPPRPDRAHLTSASCTAPHHARGAHLGRAQPGGQGPPLGQTSAAGREPAGGLALHRRPLRQSTPSLRFPMASGITAPDVQVAPFPDPASGDQLSTNLMAPESSSWSHKPRTQTRHCPSPHSQAPLGAPWCGADPS